MELDKYFPLKSCSIFPTNIYLGGEVSHIFFPNGVKAYVLSSIQYAQEDVNNVEDHLDKQGMRLCALAYTPISPSYWIELDATNELSPSDSSYFQ